MSEHYTWVLKKTNSSEYCKRSMGLTYSMANEIETPWFEIWKKERLWPALNVLAKQSLNGKTFLAPFPAEIRKWNRLVSARVLATPDNNKQTPPKKEFSINPTWSTIFSFINDKIEHIRRPSMNDMDDDNVLVFMCVAYIQGGTNPCFIPLMNDILLNGFHQEKHAANAERIVGITNKMGRDWVLRIRAHAMDLVLILTGMRLRPKRAAMRDRIVAYLYKIHSNCE